MSKDQSVKGQSIALAVVALLAGILVGVVGAHSFNITDETVTEVVRQESATDTRAAELRASLNTRMVEHVHLASEAALASYRNDPAAPQRFAALEMNTGKLAEELSVLESVSREDLERIGAEHGGAARAYAVAVRRQDQQAMRDSRQQLDSLTGEVARAVSEDIEMPREELETALETHTDHMRQIVNAHVAGNYEEARTERKRARDHMWQLSNRIAADIVAAYPDEFE